MNTFRRFALWLVIMAVAGPAIQSSVLIEDDYRFEIHRRINAHGDEFMSLALTKDERYLIIGTESGKLIIWGIPERRVLKEMDQGSPVHRVVSLTDPDWFIAAGGPHSGPIQLAVVRKWRISTGTSEALQGINGGTIVSLAVDPTGEFVAAGSKSGQLAVWNSTNSRLVTTRSFDAPILSVATNGHEIYLTKLPPDGDSANSILRVSLNDPKGAPVEIIQESESNTWGGLALSPDGQFMAAHVEGDRDNVVVFDISAGRKISTLDARSYAWYGNNNLVLFDHNVAIARVSIDSGGHVSRSELSEGAKWHVAGTPSSMTGQVVSADGSTAWEIFQLGAALVELDLNKKALNELLRLRGYLYALDVREGVDLMATGGDDEFVRVRKLADLTLVKEFRVATGVPQGVALMNDSKHIVFSASGRETPTQISIGNLISGEVRTLFEVDEPFIRVDAARGGFIYSRANRVVLAKFSDGVTIREYLAEGDLHAYAVSANGEWLVVANDEGKLYRFEVKTGKRSRVRGEGVESLTKVAITNDGRYVYTTEFHAKLKRRDVRTNRLTELAEIRGQARSLRLSRDEKEIVIGGNHRDVAVYEVATGERRLYFEIAASDFYVTNVWLGGNRLLFSTDAGLLFDGLVNR